MLKLFLLYLQIFIERRYIVPKKMRYMADHPSGDYINIQKRRDMI